MGVACCGLNHEQKITIILRTAMQKASLFLQQKWFVKIDQIIANKSTQETSIGQLIFQYKSRQGKEQRRDLLQRLIVRSNNSSQSIIVYDGSFFIGRIQSGKANDQNGKLYLLQEDIRYILKGKWEKDYFMQGVVIEVNSLSQRNIFSLAWDPITAITNIKISMAPNTDLTSNQILEYSGQINTKGKDMNEILNGWGTIKFANGCVYEGIVKNGLMHTEDGPQPALFKSQNEAEIYHGHYRQGYKHGFGSSTIKYQGDVCKFTMEWRNGIPVLSTFKLKQSFMSSVMRTRYRQ